MEEETLKAPVAEETKPWIKIRIPDFEDKDLVVLVVFFLCVGAMIAFTDQNAKHAADIVEKAMYGLFGIVTGTRNKPPTVV